MRCTFFCLLLFSVLACERRAPGPAECTAFAARALGVPASAREISPQLESDLDDLTRRCLTTPFDRKLLDCVNYSGHTRACLRDFELRQGATLPQPERRIRRAPLHALSL